ncbi:ABC transporter ATP-binding protein [Candidatus Bathyarchaeota archaeon]|nr:ABC transporter ATP-binding protein [Candidatus Bathyarchaeota archaeon]
MLKIENLSVDVHGKDILRRISLEIKKGELHALLGPNASGKSTLAYAVMGFPEYNITEGRMYFKGKDITGLSIEERVNLGITLAFQHPPTIKGVKLSKLLEKISKRTVDVKQFPVTSDLLEREINVGFSGGERKLSEIIQIISLNPSFVVFDELDAGLDIENLERLTSVVKDKLLNNDVSILLITHRGNVLRFLRPDIAHVMLDGEIVCSSQDWRKIWKTIVRYGYEKCKECKLPSGQP